MGAVAVNIKSQAVAGGGAGDAKGGVVAGIANTIVGAEAEGVAGSQVDHLAARRAGAQGGADGPYWLVVVIHFQITLAEG